MLQCTVGVRSGSWIAGATHFLMKTLAKVASEMALHVLRAMNIFGVKALLAAIRA
jgi:hypothetical protein